MLTRRFGKTDLRTTVLTFGAMRIPPEAGETDSQTRDRAFRTLRRALDVGINHIETARGYGPSESLIGEALSEGVIHRDEFILTTKIAPTPTADEFRAALDDSLARLKTGRVDILDIHGINNDALLDMSLRADGTMGAARRAMDEGLVGHLGFATHAPLGTILHAIETREFESVNLHYYFINQRNRPAVQRAASLDMGVFIISPTDKGGQLFRPPNRLADLCVPLTPVEFNQRWLLAQPEVHTLSVGAARPEEFDAHLIGPQRDGPMTTEEAECESRLERALATLGSTYCSFCHACLPCPQDVHIPEILRLRNLAIAYDMREFGRYRYGMFVRRDPQTGERTGGAGHWFPGSQGDWCTDCGDCLPRCPLHLDIPVLLRETHDMLAGTAGKRLWK